MSLGKLLKKEIKKKRLKQKDIAFEMGISETALSQIIQDVYFPSQGNLDKLCSILKVRLVFSFEDIK